MNIMKFQGFAIWSLCVIAFGLFFWFIEDIARLAQLAANYAITPGVVLETELKNHGIVTVRYEVNGTTYERTFPPSAVLVGATIAVYYDPRNPDLASLQAPADALRWGLIAGGGGALLLGSALGVYLAAALSVLPSKRPNRVGTSNWRLNPRYFAVLVLAGVMIGAAAQAYFRGLEGRHLIATALVLSGSLWIVIKAFTQLPQVGWSALQRSPTFLAGVAVLLAGVLLNLG
jgi:Protein of unknown function (DUF3592)